MARALTTFVVACLFRDFGRMRRLIVAILVMTMTLLLHNTGVAQASYDTASFNYDASGDEAPSGHEADGRLRDVSVQQSSESRPTSASDLRLLSKHVAPGSTLAKLCSFSGETEVLMADGTTKPISEIAVGDLVLAEDPETGERGPREVTHLWAHQDTIIDLRIEGGSIATTEDHPFWNESDAEWQRADSIDSGDLVLTSGGATLTVDGIDWESARTTTAYNLTVNDIHTYYVQVDNEAVLVHNTCNLAERASGLRARVGSNRVTVQTPNGRLHVDLEGKAHWDKALQTTVDTPHVRFDTRHVGPNGQVNYSRGTVRDATHDDLRIVERILEERGF